MPLMEKVPVRGFSNVRFSIPVYSITLDRINAEFEDGEKVSRDTLLKKGYPLRRVPKLKILSTGDLTKKVVIEAHAFSKNAVKKLEEQNIEFNLVK